MNKKVQQTQQTNTKQPTIAKTTQHKPGHTNTSNTNDNEKKRCDTRLGRFRNQWNYVSAIIQPSDWLKKLCVGRALTWLKCQLLHKLNCGHSKPMYFPGVQTNIFLNITPKNHSLHPYQKIMYLKKSLWFCDFFNQ